MTKIIDAHIRNLNDTFIVIFAGIPLGYIICYNHYHGEYTLRISHYKL